MKILATILLLVFASINNSNAFTTTASPYFGLSLSKSKLDMAETGAVSYKGLMPSSYTNTGFFFGLDLHENLGFEFGYENSRAKSMETNGAYGIDSLSARIATIRYDILGKYNMTPETTLVGILGIVQGISSVSTSGSAINGNVQQGGFSNGWEYGAGVWRAYDERIFGKVEYRKQNVEYGGIANSSSSLLLGVGIRL